MTDWKTLNEQRLAKLHPIFAARVRGLLDAMESDGINILVTQGLRTREEQDALYAQGRTKPGPIVTNARGGQSQHNYGLAVDLCPDDLLQAGLQLDWNASHPAWKKLLATAPRFGLAEGDSWSFKDTPHFYPAELPSTTGQLRFQYAKGGMKAVWGWFESVATTAPDPSGANSGCDG